MNRRILISAFGLAPNHGSDAEVGWKWVTTLPEFGYDVWVITREANRQGIESELARQGAISNLHFIYHEHRHFQKLIRGSHLRGYLYYYLWQWGAYRKAFGIHQKIRFDMVHHVTWVSCRQPSFMGGLGIPFIFGPLAGGETAPWRLRAGYGMRQWVADLFRDFVNFVVRFDPCLRNTFRKASRIYVTSDQTLKCLPRPYREKARIQLAIGIDGKERGGHSAGVNGRVGDEFRVLYVGRFIGWKGMHLGLRAFKKILKVFPNARLTMIGRGREETEWRKLADSLSIMDYITWVPWVQRKDLSSFYSSHDVFLYPSLHDSGGLVVLEAMSHGLPVVCLNLGGPGIIVNQTCGFPVVTRKRSQGHIVDEIADALLRLAQDQQLRHRLSKGATERVMFFGWDTLVTKIYGDIRGQ